MTNLFARRIGLGLSIGAALACAPARAENAGCVGALRAPLSLAEEKAAFETRLSAFLSKHSARARVVSDAPVAFGGERGELAWRRSPRFVVISIYDLDPTQKAELKKDYDALRGIHSIAFPMRRGADHLYTQIGNRVYDYDYRYGYGGNREDPKTWTPHFFDNDFRWVSSDDKIEPIVSLTEGEYARLDAYVANAKNDVTATIGRFGFEGVSTTAGDYTRNVPPGGSGHNCTSWLTTAALGSQGEALIDLLGPRTAKSGNVTTNPGWLLAYLLTQGRAERLPAFVYWTAKPLETTLANLPSSLTQWDFNLH